MKLTLTALTVAATMFASSASAADHADLQKLKDTGNCASCDLKDDDLRDAGVLMDHLWEADQESAGLSGANLTNANLGGSLYGANLNFARMQGTILYNTTMLDSSVIYSGC